eukprot:356327-Chlamydomonas_euryale.AAC.2
MGLVTWAWLNGLGCDFFARWLATRRQPCVSAPGNPQAILASRPIRGGLHGQWRLEQRASKEVTLAADTLPHTCPAHAALHPAVPRCRLSVALARPRPTL